jgi:hypothetical protein
MARNSISKRNALTEKAIEEIVREAKTEFYNSRSANEGGKVIGYEMMVVERPKTDVINIEEANIVEYGIKGIVSVIPKEEYSRKIQEREDRRYLPDGEELRREMFNRQHGLDVFLNENGKEAEELIKDGMYDVRQTGCGDIALPGHIRRALHSGETPTYNRSLIHHLY